MLENLTFRRIFSRLSIATPHFSPLGKRIKMQVFIVFAARKFGSFGKNIYLCRQKRAKLLALGH